MIINFDFTMLEMETYLKSRGYTIRTLPEKNKNGDFPKIAFIGKVDPNLSNEGLELKYGIEKVFVKELKMRLLY